MRVSFSGGILFFILALCFSAAAQKQPRSFMAYVHVIDVDLAKGKNFEACVIVGDNAEFRYELWPHTPTLQAHDVKVYVGKLAPDKFQEFKSLVQSPDLANFTSSHPRGSLVAQRDWQAVAFRIHRSSHTQEFDWITVDGRNPMPPAVQSFMPWVEQLHKTLGKAERRSAARACLGLDATPDFTPKLQQR